MHINFRIPKVIEKRRQTKGPSLKALQISIEALTLQSLPAFDQEAHLPTLSNARKRGIEVYIEHSGEGDLIFTFRDPKNGEYLNGKAALRRHYEKRGWSLLAEDERLENGLLICPIEAELNAIQR